MGDEAKASVGAGGIDDLLKCFYAQKVFAQAVIDVLETVKENEQELEIYCARERERLIRQNSDLEGI